MKGTFRFAYGVLLVIGVVAVTALAILVSTHDAHKTKMVMTGLTPITNKSTVPGVNSHFTGKPFNTVAASVIGLASGKCFVYTNKKNWVVLRCIGKVPSGV